MQGTNCPPDSLANGATCKATCKGNVNAIGIITCNSGALGGFSYCAHPDNITRRETITLVQGQLEFQADASPTQKQAERAMCRAFNFYDCEYVLSALLSENLETRRLSLIVTEGRRLIATHTIDYAIKVPPWSSIQSVLNKAKEFMNPNSAAVKAFKASMLASRIKVTSVTQEYPPVVRLNVLNLVLRDDSRISTPAPDGALGAAGDDGSIIEEWWFWLIVVGIPILLGISTYCFLKKYNEKVMKKNTKCINGSCGRVFQATNLSVDAITGQSTAECPFCGTECPVVEDHTEVGKEIQVLWPPDPDQIDAALAITDMPPPAAIEDQGFYQGAGFGAPIEDSPRDDSPRSDAARRLALPSPDDGDLVPDEADGRSAVQPAAHPSRGGASTGAGGPGGAMDHRAPRGVAVRIEGETPELEDEGVHNGVAGEADEEIGGSPRPDDAERQACLDSILGDIENMMDNPKIGNGHGTNGTNGHPAIADGRAEDFV